MKKRALRILDPLLQSAAAGRILLGIVKLWTSSASRLSPDEGLRRLFSLDDHVRQRIDGLAISLDGGVHSKHRLTGYHDFFLERVSPGQTVLDVGCGKGELAHDLAARNARVTGVDFSPAVLAVARSRFADSNLDLVDADVLTWEAPHDFDVVVLSNVLEHIEARVALLVHLIATVHPERVLIRVPSIERDWIVPLRRELGLFYYGDPTHETEYTVEQIQQETAAAGLQIDELVQRWGELWVSARPETQPPIP